MFKKLLFKNFKFIFRINQWGKHRLTPAGTLITGSMIASGIFGVDIRQSMAFQVFSITFALLLTAILGSIIFRSRFEFARYLPDFGTVNERFKYKIRLTNKGNRNERDLLIIDELETVLPEFHEFLSRKDPQDKNRNRFDRMIGYPRLMGLIRNKRGGTIEPHVIPWVAPGESTMVEIEMSPTRRGYIQLNHAFIGRPDPLGLCRALKKIFRRDRVLILPRMYKAPPVQLAGLRKYQKGGMSQASSVGDSQEFMSLREYRPGDPLRAIHWRSYAKNSTPIVKEFHDEFFVRQGLILDTFQEEKADSLFEEAISVAASFCKTLPSQDSLLDLLFVGDKAYRFTAGRGLGRPENMLEILACAKACRDLPFSAMHDLIPAYVHESSGLICVLLDWGEERKALIDSLVAMNMPVLVFLVIEAEDNEQYSSEGTLLPENHFHVLKQGNIQAHFNELGSIRIKRQ